MYSVRVGATAALYTRKDIQVKIVLRVETLKSPCHKGVCSRQYDYTASCTPA